MTNHKPSVDQRQKCKVAVITATYNSAMHIRDCLASVESQTHLNTYHVVIDGKSEDDTMAIVQKSSNIRLIYLSEKDSGIYAAWNKGIKLVNADWYLFLGSDDILLPHAIEILIKQADRCAEVNLVSAVSILLHSNGQFARIMGAPFSRKVLWHHMPNSNCSTIYHHTLLSDDSVFDEDLKSAADYGFLMKKRQAIRSIHLSVVISAMKLGGISNKRQRLSIGESYQQKLKFYPKHSHWILMFFYWASLLKYELLEALPKINP